MVLDGHQFYSFEIQPVLAMAANEAMKSYMDTDDPIWLAANVSIVTTKTKINAMADGDASGEPVAIRKGSALWSEIDAVLVPVAQTDSISDEIAALPVDSGPLSAARPWVRPVAAGAGLAALLGLGYLWVRKK